MLLERTLPAEAAPMARPKKFPSLLDFGIYIESFDEIRLNRRLAFERGNYAAMYNALVKTTGC